MVKEFLECGRLVSVHGLQGGLKCQHWCDSDEVFTGLRHVYLKDGTELKLIRVARQKNILLVMFDGITTVEQASKLVGQVLTARREDIPLPEGGYFINDLMGLSVYDADTGECYGQIDDVQKTGANDVYHVKSGERLRLVPVIPDVVKSVDVQNGRIEIRPLEGLFDED